jgi:hypothetical protein
MTRGYPDWFGQSIFLKYGAAKTLSLVTHITGPGPVTIGNLTGKGILYEALVSISTITFYATELITFRIDGNDFRMGNLGSNAQRISTLAPGSICVDYFSAEMMYGRISLVGPLSYDSSAQIIFETAAGDLPIITTVYYYADILT